MGVPIIHFNVINCFLGEVKAVLNHRGGFLFFRQRFLLLQKLKSYILSFIL